MAGQADAHATSDQANILELTINGRPRQLQVTTATVAGVVGALEMKADRIAIEQNGNIVRRGTWSETPVRGGDRLEIVHFVGGGV